MKYEGKPQNKPPYTLYGQNKTPNTRNFKSFVEYLENIWILPKLHGSKEHISVHLCQQMFSKEGN